MRKLLVSISLVVLVCVSSVSARGLFVTTEENPNFVDANGDGICDNYIEGSHRHLFIDEDGDGICDNRNNHIFVDENKDGICDSCDKVHHGKQFIDNDGDGICDNVGEQKNENVKHHHGKRNSTMNKGRNK